MDPAKPLLLLLLDGEEQEGSRSHREGATGAGLRVSAGECPFSSIPQAHVG